MIDFNLIKADLISKLGMPYFEKESCILFCGDTLKLQKKISCQYVDAVITSPPYNPSLTVIEEKKTINGY